MTPRKFFCTSSIFVGMFAATYGIGLGIYELFTVQVAVSDPIAPIVGMFFPFDTVPKSIPLIGAAIAWAITIVLAAVLIAIVAAILVCAWQSASEVCDFLNRKFATPKFPKDTILSE